MNVKELVGRFETETGSKPARKQPSVLPSPARFLHRSGTADQGESHSLLGLPSTSRLRTDNEHLTNTYEHASSYDITDTKVDSVADTQTLHPERTNKLSEIEPNYLRHRSASSSGPDVARHEHRLPPHKPIPATTVFSRTAPLLYLPNLDNYLSSLPTFNFPTLSSTSEPLMFPPMDRLAASGKSLEDLELNSEIAPIWRNKKTILGSIVNTIIGLTGSSALATFYSLQGLMNTVQVFALILSTIVPVGGQDVKSQWRKLFLGTIPNILALNFASTTMQSLVFLLIFMAIAGCLLFLFYRSVSSCNRYNTVEGLQKTQPVNGQWGTGLLIISFLLTVIYLPLSIMAVHVLVWSQDLWIVPNPYVNATTSPPIVPALGPAEEFRDPLDFCWTTTMKQNEINYAPVIIIVAAIAFITLTIWFPISLGRVIKRSVPEVDPFTELGRRRTEADMDREYQRLLARDRNTFSFIYSGFRRGWGTFEATYLFAKLSTLIIVAVIDPDNCLFRTLSRTNLALARQILLLISTIGFFLLQCFLAPFLDPINNASEWISRLNYVVTAAISLAIALNIPGKEIFETYVLYAIYVVTYGLSFYFTIINWSFMHLAVKRLTRRIDFSLDIFSPRLDISSTSIHTRRRIWQESITTLLLTNTECAIPNTQPMIFSRARDLEYPPYLLSFQGSPGERHVENLKILREIGSFEYNKACTLMSGPDHDWYRYLQDEVQKHFVGPDSYWKNPWNDTPIGYTNYFGSAWWIPFPPTLVIQYDHGPLAVLREASEIETYIQQNSSPDIQRRRQIRASLRALDGQTVVWHYEHIHPIGNTWSLWGRRFNAQTSDFYSECVLNIKRRGNLVWEKTQLGSGFDIELTFGKNVRVASDVIGLNDEYDLTPALAKFLSLNRTRIPEKLAHMESVLASYRHHLRKECRHKSDVLTYRFLSYVYDQPRDPTGLAESSIEHERDLRVRALMIGSEAVFQSVYERLAYVSTSEAATWWYIFWDDLWRRNRDAIPGLKTHATDFNPHYPSSIAYRLIPRPALENFLIQRGLMSHTQSSGFFYSGLLNKIYLRLNDTVFRGSSRAILFHVGTRESDLDMDEVFSRVGGSGFTLGTGGGTDFDDASIRPRPAYRWEGLLDDPLREEKRHERRFFAKMGAWFGLTPLWKSSMPSEGVSLDVRLDHQGRFVLIDEIAFK